MFVPYFGYFFRGLTAAVSKYILYLIPGLMAYLYWVLMLFSTFITGPATNSMQMFYWCVLIRNDQLLLKLSGP